MRTGSPRIATWERHIASWGTPYLATVAAVAHQLTFSNFAEAKDAYRNVLLIDPRHANALASLGIVYHMNEEYQEAIQQYHEVSPLTIHTCFS